MIKEFNFLRCISCAIPITGIHSYKARENCVECGGVALGPCAHYEGMREKDAA